MSRLQLAINVSNLEEAIDFYRTFFKTEPHKVRPGYANFAIDEPPLKLVLMEGGEPGTINHMGVEVFSPDDVLTATEYLTNQGLPTTIEEKTDCCFAVQDKVWVDGPDNIHWETYVVLDDQLEVIEATSGAAGCCGSQTIDVTAKSQCC